MALIREVDVDWDAKGSVHPTTVSAKVKIIRSNDREGIVQIDTFGSDARKLEGKISQTLQMDKEIASRLVDVLKKVYGL